MKIYELTSGLFKIFFESNIDRPMTKKVWIPFQFFNKLPVDIIGQKIIIKLIKPIFASV